MQRSQRIRRENTRKRLEIVAGGLFFGSLPFIGLPCHAIVMTTMRGYILSDFEATTVVCSAAIGMAMLWAAVAVSFFNSRA